MDRANAGEASHWSVFWILKKSPLTAQSVSEIDTLTWLLQCCVVWLFCDFMSALLLCTIHSLFRSRIYHYSSTNLTESHVFVLNKMYSLFALFWSCFVCIDLRILYILYSVIVGNGKGHCMGIGNGNLMGMEMMWNKTGIGHGNDDMEMEGMGTQNPFPLTTVLNAKNAWKSTAVDGLRRRQLSWCTHVDVEWGCRTSHKHCCPVCKVKFTILSRCHRSVQAIRLNILRFETMRLSLPKIFRITDKPVKSRSHAYCMVNLSNVAPCYGPETKVLPSIWHSTMVYRRERGRCGHVFDHFNRIIETLHCNLLERGIRSHASEML